MGVVYTKYLAIFGRLSVCSHQTIDRVSQQQQQPEQQRLRSGQEGEGEGRLL